MIRSITFIVLLITTTLCYGDEEASPCGENNEGCNIGVKTLVFFDKSRERPIITEVYYPPERDGPCLVPTSSNFKVLKEKRNAPVPRGEAKLPLILLSHGNLGDRYSHAWLQEILAANGYIVAIPDHFGNTSYMQRAEDSLKQWERPKDISFLIDQLLEDPLLKQHIDPQRIGFIGYSPGGLTGVWLAGGVSKNYPIPSSPSAAPVEGDEGAAEAIIKSIDFSKAKKSYQDKRIKAEFLMAPTYGFAFPPEGLSSIDIPIMIVAGEGDPIAPLKENAEFYAENIKSAALKVIPGKAGHYIFLNSSEQKEQNRLPSHLATDDPSIDRSKIHEEVAGMALKFFDKYLKGQHENRDSFQK